MVLSYVLYVTKESKQYSQDLQKCTESSQCQIEQLPSTTTAKACNEIGKESLTSLTWPWLTITTISGHQSFCKLSFLKLNKNRNRSLVAGLKYYSTIKFSLNMAS